MLDEWLLVLGWIGAALAALLGTALLLRPTPSRPDRWLGSGLLVAALAAGLISLSRGGAPRPAFEAAEVVATLVAGPLVFGWIALLVSFDAGRWIRFAGFAPAALWAAAALAGAPFAGDPRAIRGAVLVFIAWSAGATVLAILKWRGLGARARHAVGLALGGIGLLHGAQLLRLLASGSTPPHLVSATIGLLLGAICFTALRGARLPISLGAAGPPTDASAAELVAAFERLMNGERVFTAPGLAVGVVARRLGVPASTLSAVLNRHAGTTFADRVTQLRIEEARRLLADPKLEHLAVEAIGARAGFGSRSVFYAEFRRRTGSTPAEYREAAAGTTG